MPADSISRADLKDAVLHSLNCSEHPLMVEQLARLHPVAPLRIRRALRALHAEGAINYVKKGRFRYASPAVELPTLTELESSVFAALLKDDETHVDEVSIDGMSARSFSGRVSSLVKKGLLTRETDRDVTLTRIGEAMTFKIA